MDNEKKDLTKRLFVVETESINRVHLMVVKFGNVEKAVLYGDMEEYSFLHDCEMHYRKGMSLEDVAKVRQSLTRGATPDGGKRRIGFVVEVSDDALVDVYSHWASHTPQKPLISTVKYFAEKEKELALSEKLEAEKKELRRKALNPFEIKTIESKKYVFLNNMYETEREMNEAVKDFLDEHRGVKVEKTYVFNGWEHTSLEEAEKTLASFKEKAHREGTKFIGRLSKPELKGSSLLYSAYDLIGDVSDKGIRVYKKYEDDHLVGVRGKDGVVVGTEFIPTEVYTLMHFEGDKLVTEHLDSFTFDFVTYV